MSLANIDLLHLERAFKLFIYIICKFQLLTFNAQTNNIYIYNENLTKEREIGSKAVKYKLDVVSLP